MNKIRIFLTHLAIVKVVQVVQRHQNYLNQTGIETELRKKIEMNLASVALRQFPVLRKKNHQRVEKLMNLN